MPEFRRITVEETPYLYTERSCSMDPADISRAMGEAFGAVMAHMQDRGVAPAGPALSVYYDMSPEGMTFRAGFTVTRDDLAAAGGEVKGDVTPAGEVIHFTHEGSYATLRDDYDLLTAHLESKGLNYGVPAWEVYVNDPDTTDEDALVTECYVTVF